MLINNILDGQQGILTLLFGGSGTEIDVNLTPDASNNIHISNDLNLVSNLVVFDLCSYVLTQPCMRTYAVIEVKHHSDMVSDSTHFVVVTCSEFGHLIFTEIDGPFSLDIFALSPNLSGSFHIDDAQQDWSVISPDFMGWPTITDTHIIDKMLLCVDLDHAPIADVGTIGCVPLCVTRTSDADHICQLLECCSDMEAYLEENYPDYMSKIHDMCKIQYDGPVCGRHAVLNLTTHRMRFGNFAIHCSDKLIEI